MQDDWSLHPSELLQMARRVTGAPGCDGWKSQDVKRWPESGWAILLDFDIFGVRQILFLRVGDMLAWL